ncbi:P2Y purinoceptor 4-like [Liolophura sinensis]|uniref:P2Y purinoceptor 4-like n=1 Tax=Liolophura sinensis TaxID=3198878 RepID=UPI0031590FF2
MQNSTIGRENTTLPGSDPFQKFVSSLMKYAVPTIVWFGLLGNALSLAVFLSKRLRANSSSVYLSATAISDSAFLLSLFVVWLAFAKVDLIHTAGWCQTVIFITYLCSFLSVWFIVCITNENFVLCNYPKKAIRFCDVKRSVCIVITLVILGVVLYSFSLWTTGVKRATGKYQCTVMEEYVHLTKAATYIDTAITLILPYGMITYMLVAIAVNMFQRRPTPGKPLLNHVSLACRRYLSRNVCVMRVTTMLTAISGSYLILTLPSHIIKLRHLIIDLTTPTLPASRMELNIQQILQIVYYSSFACKVFIYICFGKNFRKCLLQLIRWAPHSPSLDHRGDPRVYAR